MGLCDQCNGTMTSSYLSPMGSHSSITMEVVDRRPARSAGTGALVGVAIGVGVAGVIAAIVLFFCIRSRCFRKYKQQLGSKSIYPRKLELVRFRLDVLQRATNQFSEECLVGSGAFGKVYRGVFDENWQLAIKKSHADSYISVGEFRNEVELLSRVQHRNLVGLIGYCDEAGQKILIYEYVRHGSLLEYIAGKKRKPLTWIQRVNVAIGAAKGIAHLHEGVQPSIIHRDLKPSNILLGDGFEAKVSDFGLVKSGPVGDASHVSSQIKGTPGYLDPAYCTSLHLTPFSDVYSFGIILLQLVTARPAVDTLRPHSRYHIVNWARPSLERGCVEEIIDTNLLLEACNMEMMLKMGQLGLQCVVESPKNRPTMSQVARELEEALNSAVTFIHKQPSAISHKLVERKESQAFSIDDVKLERFYVETDGFSIKTETVRCIDVNSISRDINYGEFSGISEERSRCSKVIPIS